MEKTEVLIIRSGTLGDTLLLLPALAALSKKGQVTIAGRRPGIGFLNPFVRRTLNLETGNWHRLFGGMIDTGKNLQLPVSKVDSVVVFSADGTGLLSRNLQGCFPGTPVFQFPPFPKQTEKIHVARYLARCLQSASLPISENEAMDIAAKKPLLEGPRRYEKPCRIVIHPGSGDPRKNHSPEFWKALMRRLLKLSNVKHLKPLLLLGPAEQNSSCRLKRIGESIGPLESFFSPPPEKLLELLGTAALYLGHDSGVTHLSGLMGTPTLALFRTTDPIQWRPLGPKVHVIHRTSSDTKCLEMVIEAVRKI